MEQGRLSNFKRLYDQSEKFTTLADVADPRKLEPWIQWYSTHTGLAYDQHRVFHLTVGPRAKHRDISQHLLPDQVLVISPRGDSVKRPHRKG
jgi:hypothetical protein